MEARDDDITINERIIYVREKYYGKRGKSRFAKAIGIPITTYVEYEKERKVPADVVDHICRLTGVRWQWLVRGARPITEDEARKADRELAVADGEKIAGTPGNNFDELRPEQTTTVPLMGAIVAGPPALAEEWDGIQCAKVLAHQGLPQRNRYVLRVQGNSMWPEIKPDDLVLIENREDLSTDQVYNRICAVLLNGEATLKRIRKPSHPDTDIIVELASENSDMPTIQVRESDNFMILGVAIEVVSRKL